MYEEDEEELANVVFKKSNDYVKRVEDIPESDSITNDSSDSVVGPTLPQSKKQKTENSTTTNTTTTSFISVLPLKKEDSKIVQKIINKIVTEQPKSNTNNNNNNNNINKNKIGNNNKNSTVTILPASNGTKTSKKEEDTLSSLLAYGDSDDD